MKRIIEKTEDGSATLFVPELDEHYHSTKGAHTESQHIFIDMGLKASKAEVPCVLEVGFGTGLNALLTLEEADKGQRKVEYISLERYPLTWQEIEPLNYSNNPLFEKMHSTPWEERTIISPYFALKKVEADANVCIAQLEPESIDVVYFDAFAPEKQPEMWNSAIFEQLYAAMRIDGILTTYCAKGVVRRMLQAAGFMVERLPGPPGGKREILRANKL